MDIKILNFNKNAPLIQRLRKTRTIASVDDIKNQLVDLWKVRNPSKHVSDAEVLGFINTYRKKRALIECGNWIYYPWRQRIIHILEKDMFQELRTARNKLLIKESEQELFQNYSVAIAGLSVGNSIANTIRLQGGSRKIKIADNDIFEVSNMNRIRAGVPFLGERKTTIVRCQILEIDPYSKISEFSTGVTKKNVKQFCSNVNLIFDEVDDFNVKVLLRIEAKRKKIPLIMITDNDDGVLIDYYPYHRKKSIPLFHGIKDKEVLNVYRSKKVSKKEMVMLSMKIVGSKNISKRMRSSLMSVGKSLYTWPQLGTAALSAGVVGCYFARELAIGRDIRFNRKSFRINDLMNVAGK